MALLLELIFTATLATLPVPDFELRDTTGAAIRLPTGPAARPTVVVFLGTDCPMARLYSVRLKEMAGRFPTGAVTFLAINANAGDDVPSMAAFLREYPLAFPYAKDTDGRVAELFGASRTPQAFVLDAQRRIRYRGRIDDQYAPGGKNRGAPTREDLAEAVREVLAGRPVSVARTECTGCVIDKPRRATPPPRVTYSRDIAPILATHCRACHRPGEIGPFSLLSYSDATAHAGTIVEVIENGTMPPWSASPAHGRFRNERRLSDEHKRLIAEWVRLGCPEGAPLPPEPAPAPTKWHIGEPDAVFQIPTAFAVPAEGIIEYQNFIVDPGFKTDVWVRAAEVHPGNRRVVHHVNVFLLPPGETRLDQRYEAGPLESFALTGYDVGSAPDVMPEGMAKRIPAGWRIHFLIHYTAVGSPQTDRTEVGLQFIDPALVRKEVATKLLYRDDFAIPPHATGYRIEKTWTADRDYLLLSMYPHMHLRGKTFRFAAEYPDGTSEILLDVPRYDFNWQHRYVLAEPKRLTAGTVIRCTGVYDNSAANPSNPDPSATVQVGLQTWDEMFNGFFDIALADQDLAAERAAIESKRVRSQQVGIGALALVGLWGARLWRKRRA
ncbi:redoxin domain-containing protein [Gemmata sp. G18]|uniref:Redoxin domain-containing protein n=1 Tax=Gemmata palustris TaxID=2822762 RepID=A0ABS5C1Y4_9BACT|nr:redoxin domain-containing protein [Gemmata palustris]MBP3959974.1 redoxin domain-containing protein [Gemmata palustris]